MSKFVKIQTENNFYQKMEDEREIRNVQKKKNCTSPNSSTWFSTNCRKIQNDGKWGIHKMKQYIANGPELPYQ